MAASSHSLFSRVTVGVQAEPTAPGQGLGYPGTCGVPSQAKAGQETSLNRGGGLEMRGGGWLALSLVES